MSNEADSASSKSQNSKRSKTDWFRAPVTDYSNVSTLSYPKGPRASVTELNENNHLVDVLFYRVLDRAFLRTGREETGWIVQLLVDSADLQDAKPDSDVFASIKIRSKSLIDVIRPALASVYIPIPDHVSDDVSFYPPFAGLFFAQARLLETLKHGGLPSIKERDLRAFICVIQVALRKLNQDVRDLASKRLFNFDLSWTLYPLGSLVVFETGSILHIGQVIENEVTPLPLPPIHGSDREDRVQSKSVRLATFDFDGYNFGRLEDTCRCYETVGNVSISSHDYRPLWYEERFGDSSIVKKAIERGKEVLTYQAYHHRQYVGKGFPLQTRLDSRETEINGRVVVDCLQARKAWDSRRSSRLGFSQHSEYTIMPMPARRQEIYNEMRSLFLSSTLSRPGPELAEKRRRFFGSHDKLLMLMRSDLPAWSLEHNDWFVVDVSSLKPVRFDDSPMDRLSGTTTREFGLLNTLVNERLQLMTQRQSSDEQKTREKHDKPLMVVFSGQIGTGKTSTVQAIGELHQHPLMLLALPTEPQPPTAFERSLSQFLKNAMAWQAIVYIDDAYALLGAHKGEISDYSRHMRAIIVTHIEKFYGVVFLNKRENQQLIHTVLRHVRAYINFEPFSIQKREKIWRKLLCSSESGAWSLPVSEDTVQCMSAWDMNGHEIEHLYNNFQLLYRAGRDQEVSLAELEELKKLTVVPAGEWAAIKECDSGLTHRSVQTPGDWRYISMAPFYD